MESTFKPSVDHPKGKTETGTEELAWAVGGKVLVMRSFNDRNQPTALGIFTFDSKDNTYRYWHFAKGVYGGQWRMHWNEATEAFQLQGHDMPPGWQSMGQNRVVNRNTINVTAVIKDDNGRVILDVQSRKTRID
ncbi:MAG: hypothetical protein KDA84_00940 [Planctomycetaceae bacterium]|nr:hypothetical protein [Planctomycetaceae bacterium]